MLPDLDNYSPVESEAQLSGTDAWGEFPVPNCEYLRLYPISGTLRIFFNSKNNLKAFTLNEPMSVPNVDGQISTVYVYFSGAGEINLKAILSPRGVVFRV
jgi:hypothetical protein